MEWTSMEWYPPIRSGKFIVTARQNNIVYTCEDYWLMNKRRWRKQHQVLAWMELPKPYSSIDIRRTNGTASDL